jgi:hypothetical protein
MAIKYPCPLCGDEMDLSMSIHMREWHEIAFNFWGSHGVVRCLCGKRFGTLAGDNGLYRHFSKHGKDCIIVRAMQ